MEVTETLTEGLRRGFSVVVPADEMRGRREKRLVELGRDMRLPGFRPGKVPLSIVKQRYGSAVQAEIVEQSLNEATEKLLGERNLRPAGQPKVALADEGAALKGENDLAFTVEVELLPEIAQPDLRSLTLTRLKAVPSDETIGKALDEVARRNRSFEDIAEVRGAAVGEVLVTDFVGSIDGVAFEGGTANDVPVEVGGGGFIPGFAEQLEGMAPGEERSITVTFPGDYQASELAGKEARFAVTAKALRKPIEPALDDELAKKIGFEDFASLRDAISGQMAGEYGEMSRLRIKRELLDALAERAAFEAPPTMVEAEFAQIWSRVEADRTADKLDDEDRGKTEEQLRADYRAIAERRVKLGLLLAEIGRANNIQVAQDELFRAMRAEAGRYPGQEQQVFEFFQKNPRAVEQLRGPLYENKVVDFILELATVEEREVSPEELAKLDEQDETSASAASAG